MIIGLSLVDAMTSALYSLASNLHFYAISNSAGACSVRICQVCNGGWSYQSKWTYNTTK